MNLARTAQKFDTNLFTDVFSAASFYGQLEPFPDSVRSGPSTKRRILSTGPSVVIPTRRIVQLLGTKYIVASPEYDYHKGEVIRIKYPVLPVDGMFSAKSIYQTVNSQAGVSDLYAMMYVVNQQSVPDTMSDDALGISMFFSGYETVDVDVILNVGSYYYKSVTRSFIDGAGFNHVKVVDLGYLAVRNVQVVSRSAKNLITETYTTTTYSVVKALGMLSSLFYKFVAADIKGIEPGDYSYWLSKSVVLVKPIEGSLVDGRTVVACKENPAGVWEVRTRLW